MEWNINENTHWFKRIFLGFLLGLFSYILIILTVIFSPILMIVTKKYEVKSSFGNNFEITFKGEIQRLEDSEIIDR